MPFMAEDFPTRAVHEQPDDQGQAGGNLAFTVSYSMAKDSKNKPAAWTLLTYLAGRPGMATWTSKGLALPSRKRRQAGPRPGGVPRRGWRGPPWQFAPGFAKVMTSRTTS